MSRQVDVTSPRILRELFEQYGLSPHKRWGQNFLIDANIVRKIISALEVGSGDLVIEVGPGAGALTFALSEKGCKVVAVEIDSGLALMLVALLSGRPNVKVLRQDALQVNWKSLIQDNFEAGQPVRLVSNLPYVISGPFMFAIFKESFPFYSATLMLQKEVAQRLVAKPGDSDYGALSVISAYFCRGKILFEVKPGVFWPRPKVGSAVLSLTRRKRVLNVDEERWFINLVQILFRQRRKMILNNMIGFDDLSRQEASYWLEAVEIDPSVRPEDVEPLQFAMLARITYNRHK